MHTRVIEQVETVRNHWWWRPGWRRGRHFYACHLTLEEHPRLQKLAAHYQASLTKLPNLDLIPRRWLHLTMQGIGFVDEIGPEDIELLKSELRAALRGSTAPMATFQLPTVQSEAIYLRAHPPEDLLRLRLTMYEVVASALGTNRFREPPPTLQTFHPHVSIAYVNRTSLARPIVEALSPTRPPASVEVTFTAASFLTFHRDRQMYEWTHSQHLPIGRPC